MVEKGCERLRRLRGWPFHLLAGQPRTAKRLERKRLGPDFDGVPPFFDRWWIRLHAMAKAHECFVIENTKKNTKETSLKSGPMY